MTVIHSYLFVTTGKNEGEEDEHEDENRGDQNGDKRDRGAAFEQTVVDKETSLDAGPDRHLDLDRRRQTRETGIDSLKIYHHFFC